MNFEEAFYFHFDLHFPLMIYQRYFQLSVFFFFAFLENLNFDYVIKNTEEFLIKSFFVEARLMKEMYFKKIFLSILFIIVIFVNKCSSKDSLVVSMTRIEISLPNKNLQFIESKIRTFQRL